jgi:hypothetical protein
VSSVFAICPLPPGHYEIPSRPDPRVVLHERSAGKVLVKLGYRRLSVRPRHPQADEEVQEAFKKTSPRRSWHSCPSTPAM